jgi:predicted enzyme related to lactoylglutathione lyase
MSATSAVGSIAWVDLTVPGAAALRDFYKEVVGWSASEFNMGDHHDYCMHPGSTEAAPVAGICHTVGDNSDLPPQWLVYITVADLDASVARCVALGGSVIAGPRAIGSYGRFAVIRDPAGAIAALSQPPGD